MAIKKMKPTSDGVRHMSRLVVPELSKARPEKSLTVPLKSAYGRDNYGHRTNVNRQKGHKRLYRIIDFKRNKLDVQQLLNQLNTIQTELQTSHYYTTQMELKHIY